MTDKAAMQEWFWKTREQAELKEITVELATQDGRPSAPGASRTPSRALERPGFAADGHGMAMESLDIAHSGLKMG